MPKRSRTCEEDLNRLLSKVRRLERKIRERENIKPACVQAEPAAASAPSPSPTLNSDAQTGTHGLEQSDWSQYDLEPELCDQGYANNTFDFQEEIVEDITDTPIREPIDNENTPLDADSLEILGEDPSVKEKYGKEIIPELASRLQHIATAGLSYEVRKDIISKYLVPSNCLYIDAPKTNSEIKGAIPETIAKKEKGLIAKQKQMAHAISCLGEIINNEMNSKIKNKELLQKLMDLARLLCDIQHSDSITRRNFIIFSLKKDVKEHLCSTKIDSFLFSEALPETLKSLKAINKSSSELKANTNAKSKRPARSSSLSTKTLNCKPLGAAYRPRTQTGRNYQPAAPRAQQPAHSSKTSLRQPAAKRAPPQRRY